MQISFFLLIFSLNHDDLTVEKKRTELMPRPRYGHCAKKGLSGPYCLCSARGQGVARGATRSGDTFLVCLFALVRLKVALKGAREKVEMLCLLSQ